MLIKLARRTKRRYSGIAIDRIERDEMKSRLTQSLKRLRLAALCGSGLLFAQSCGVRVQDSVADGFSLFLTQSTVTILNSVFGLEGDANNGGNGNDNGDPFDPPVQP